jgi:transposase-like protein
MWFIICLIMKTNTDNIGRQLNRFSTEEWIELVAEYRNSDSTLKSFAESKEVNPNTFRYWAYDRNRLKKKKKSAKQKPPVFVEVSTPVKKNSVLEIQMPNGVRMSLSSVSKEELAFVIREVAKCLD